MSYATYDSYKDSGVDWLGEIPSDWELISLNRVSKVKSISNHPNERLLSVYLEKGVIPFEDVSEKRTNGTSDNLDKYQLVDIGDFVLNNQQAWRGSVGVSNYRGIISPAYIILEISDKLNSKFANYFFRSEKMIYQYVIHSKGVGTIQRNLYWQSFKNSLCWIPSLEEQTKIANFLDQKTAQIDQAIALKQQQIEKLNEYKQIVIQNAVTKGLNPNAPMKNSGVDWIGDIPEHWELVPLKHLLSFQTGGTPSSGSEEYYNGDLPWVTISNLDGKYTDKTNNISLKGIRQARIPISPKGSLLFSFKLSIGQVAFTHMDLYTNEAIATFKPKSNLNLEYYYYSLPIFVVHNANTNIYGAKLLNQDLIKNAKIMSIPQHEQTELANFLNDKVKSFEKSKSLLQTQIDRLKEYKNILINQAVTGKIKI